MWPIVKQLCPPLLWSAGSRIGRTVRATFSVAASKLSQAGSAPESPRTTNGYQKVYWDPKFAKILETWGEGTVWNEIKLLMSLCQGRVLDIACGTGRTMELLGANPNIEVFGCDISDILIEQAKARGLDPNRLVVCDATQMPYEDNAYQYSYSIGSLEHFSLSGIDDFIKEAHRVTSRGSFHQIPVARDGKDHGYITLGQEYYNNSVEWWLPKFRALFPRVLVCGSAWNDDVSVGQWFICLKE